MNRDPSLERIALAGGPDNRQLAMGQTWNPRGLSMLHNHPRLVISVVIAIYSYIYIYIFDNNYVVLYSAPEKRQIEK